MKVSAQYAMEHFEDLAVAVDDGEVVVIERADKPALQLVPSPTVEAATPKKRALGAGRGVLRVPSEEEWDAMDREWRKSFADKFGN
jgi:antitoxin (DNA-binding transcriptional repressor) of toxin-antitoxin stability system